MNEPVAARGARARTVGTVLAVDAVTAEVTRAFRLAQVQAILLRGAALAGWLYGEDGGRGYRDVDLLVPPSQTRAAEQILERLGFLHRQAGFGAGESAEHSGEWLRSRPAVVVDLHRTLTGAAAGPGAVWEALAEGREQIEVAGAAVDVPAIHARVLVVTLHAAQHGIAGERQLRDLGLALERAPSETWIAAARLAQWLEAGAAFGAGLRLLREGTALAASLGISLSTDTETSLRAASASATSIGFARWAGTPGAGGKLAIIERKLFPTAAFMRHWSRLARRGRLGLGLAYLWRPFWLLLRLLPSVLAWRRARG
ncbi:MAG: nucleotidyltransferase family protein [Egibacteraceae bacterium]